MLLAIDVGKGTEDLMVYDQALEIENSIQLVSPSQAQILYQQLSSDQSDKIVISGELMAGEPYHKVIYQKCKRQPESVIMSETAARSLRYNLDQVRAKGVKIVPDTEIAMYEGSKYKLSDVNWQRVKTLLDHSNIKLSDISKILLACQDHGESDIPNQSARDFRMKVIYQHLDKRGEIEDLMFNLPQIPDILPRHKSIGLSALRQFSHLSKEDIYVMDSSPAVVLGAQSKSEEIVINVGNGHTLAILFQNELVMAVYETHTGGIVPDRFEGDIIDLLSGKLDHETALGRGAHGVYLHPHFNPMNEVQIKDLLPYTLIGPNREILAEYLNTNLVHPGGNMMMAGPVGMIKALAKQDSHTDMNQI